MRLRGGNSLFSGTKAPAATIEPIGRWDRAALEAQERRDWPAYEEALREMMRTARREAKRRRVAA
jgi:hypothetical protein